MAQKFKKGDIVKVLVGHLVLDDKIGWVDICPEYVGREAEIEYSYADMYGKQTDASEKQYSIKFLDTGETTAWKFENQLELIR